MRLLPVYACLALAFAVLPDRAEAGPKAEKVLAQAVDDVIRPGYRRFEESAGRLRTTMQALCASPSEANEAAANKAFGEAVTAWGAIEFVRSGPALEKNRFERVLYYPDRKGIALKQVQAILSKRDETATTAGGLAGKSVGVQGLTALEYVLFGTGNELLATEKDGHRCRYGAAIAESVHGVAGELATAWDAPDGIAADWKKPGPENPVFRTDGEAVTELIGIMVHGLEMVREQRIEAFFSGTGTGKRPNPKLALFWRSGKTWTALGANLEGLSDIWKKAHMESMLKDDQKSIASSIAFVLRSTTRAVSTINPDITSALSSPEETAKIDFLLLNTKDAISRISDDYGAALGIGAGFSFSDGD